jgi:polysaccharide deacetylase family protein (PEP-CTERM system associated)
MAGDSSNSQVPDVFLSFDVEDWHQLAHRDLGRPGWAEAGEPFLRQMTSVLEFLDELKIKATFFVLGVTAKAYPSMVGEIAARGHEIACHGYSHDRVDSLEPRSFERDLLLAKEAIVETTGIIPLGYRAPYFAVGRDSTWAFSSLVRSGFIYDSSQYGSPRIKRRIRDVPSVPYRLEVGGGCIVEMPVATWFRGPFHLPIGDGSYWRVLPAPVLLRALGSLKMSGAHTTLYFHPYEFDVSPLRASLVDGRSGCARRLYSTLRSDAGRKLILPRLRAVAERFRLGPLRTMLASEGPWLTLQLQPDGSVSPMVASGESSGLTPKKSPESGLRGRSPGAPVAVHGPQTGP